ncbi:MAG: DoxX family protein [Acidobacteria bacterium]|nr:DoxX family protein [Acidobacteriota bacterium]
MTKTVNFEATHLQALILLNRVSLGWYVMNAGWEKVQRELASGAGAFFAGNTFQRRSSILPEFLAVPFGYGWPWLELTSGLLLIIGLFARTTAAVMAWLLLSIAIALAFSGGDEFFSRHYLMVFVPLALLLCVLGPGRYSVDRLRQTKR